MADIVTLASVTIPPSRKTLKYKLPNSNTYVLAAVVLNSKGINLTAAALDLTSWTNFVPGLLAAPPAGCTRKFVKLFAALVYRVKSVRPSSKSLISPEVKFVKEVVARIRTSN